MGLEVVQSTSSILLTQHHYTLDLLNKSCRLIDQLIYLTTTWPDISFAVQKLSQFVSKPYVIHYQFVFRILQYLKTYPTHVIFYPISTNLTLTGFAYSDLATCSSVEGL